jgi:uncharacterized protein (TIGR03382 family)
MTVATVVIVGAIGTLAWVVLTALAWLAGRRADRR